MSNKIDQCSIEHLQDMSFRKDELDAQVEKIVQGSRLNKDGSPSLTVEELRQSVKNAVENTIDYEIKQIDMEIKAAQLRAEIDATNPKSTLDVVDALNNKLMGKGGMDSLSNSLKNQMEIEFYTMMKKFGLGEDFLKRLREDKGLEKQLFIETYNLTDKIDPRTLDKTNISKLADGKTEIQRAALALKSYNEFTRQFLMSKGLGIKYHSRYVTKRKMRFDFMKEMGEDNFVDFMIDRLDDTTFEPRQTLPDGTIVQKGVDLSRKTTFLRDMYKQMEKDQKHLGTWFGDQEMSATTKSESYSRQLVYKNAEAEYDAFDKLSGGNLLRQMEDNVFGAARTAVKVQFLSYDTKALLANIRKEYADKLPPPSKKLSEVRRGYAEARLNQAVADFTGENRYTPSYISTLGNTFRFLSAFKLLGQTITSALMGDPVEAMRTTFTTSGDMFGGFLAHQKNTIKLIKNHGFTLSKNREQLTHITNVLGIVLQHASTDSSMRMARGDLTISKGSVTDFIDRYGSKAMNFATLLPHQTLMSRISSGIVGAQVFTDLMTDIASGKRINGYQKNTLDTYGFNERDLKALTKYVTKTETWGGSIYDPKGIRDNIMFAENRAQVAKDLGVSENSLNDFAVELAEKYSTYMEDFTSRATPQPQLSQKTMLLKGSDNEARNVLLGLVTQFKDTPLVQLQSYFEMVDTVKKVNGVKNLEQWGVDKETAQYFGNLLKAVGPQVGAQVTAQALIGSAMYMGFDAISSAIQGKESKAEKIINGKDQWQQKQVAFDVIGRTAAMPFMFEMMNSFSDIYGGGLEDEFFPGPAISQGLELAKILNPATTSTKKIQKWGMRQIPNWLIINVPANVLNKYILGNDEDWRKIK